ncbi:multicopper oxidase family protein [Kineococcus sp. NUM-3379]
MAEHAAARALPSRRSFLTGGVGLAATGALGWWGATSLLPGLPTDGPPLPEPPVLPLVRHPGGVLGGELTAAATATGLAYDGSSPGPLLRFREGEKVRLAFHNGTGVDSTLHLHGLPLTPAQDAPLAHLGPGGSDVREFELTPGSAGTYWYHPHAHGDVERQILAGLAGPVVVTGPLDELPGLREADDRLLALTRAGADVRVNGALHPRITARAGRVRLRLLNATAGDHLLVGVTRGRDRVPVHLVATDAGLVERPVRLREVLLAPGERAEVLVETTEQGLLGVRALPYSVYGPGGERGAERTLAVLDVPAGLRPVPLPAALRPVERLDPAGAARTRRIVLDADGRGGYTVDGRAFDVHAAHAGHADLTARLGTLEVWEVVNAHGTDHPFHLHSYPVQVLDRDGVPEPYRAWRDTVNVPARSAVRLAVPFRGAPGRTVYHCHIASHEDLGMMGVLEVTA